MHLTQWLYIGRGWVAETLFKGGFKRHNRCVVIRRFFSSWTQARTDTQNQVSVDVLALLCVPTELTYIIWMWASLRSTNNCNSKSQNMKHHETMIPCFAPVVQVFPMVVWDVAGLGLPGSTPSAGQSCYCGRWGIWWVIHGYQPLINHGRIPYKWWFQWENHL